MLNTPKFSNAPSELQSRLAQLRSKMKERGASFCLVRATDSYLNEYVPVHQSRRAFITGFTGSLGDALIGIDAAYLFVDGRYALQAKEQAPYFEVSVLPLGVSIEGACLDVLEKNAANQKVLIEEDRIPVSQLARISERAQEVGFICESDNGIIDEIRGAQDPLTHKQLWQADEKITGTSLSQRLQLVGKKLNAYGLDGFLLVALDDIAWMSGFRGSDFDYQSTFASRALILKNELFVIAPHAGIDKVAQIKQFDSLESAVLTVKNPKDTVLGFDPDATPASLFKLLAGKGFKLKAMKNPVQQMKSIKSPEEIAHMYRSFAKADDVVFSTQNWVCDQVASGREITEADVDRYVRSQFEKSGTIGLSFPPICGHAKNAAVIHHSIPDAKTPLREGELFLLDTGGIYEGGYSTDLTRTFLIGGPNTKARAAHKQMFTLVLKGAIAGMSARMPEGFTGIQLDAIVRAPFWQLGLNFAHGTGHGIGINVHEFPPRIATVGTAKLEVGHVFSIEPGFYVPNFGGVRIENLCTLVKDPEKAGFVRVIPLTFAPLDEKLINFDMLTKQENDFIQYFKERYRNKENEWNIVPGLDDLPSELMAILSKSED